MQNQVQTSMGGYNQGGQIHPQDIIDKFVAIDGLYHRIYGDELLNKLVFDIDIDSNLNILYDIFGYTDAKDIVHRRVDWDKFKKLSQIIFRYTELQNPGFFNKDA